MSNYTTQTPEEIKEWKKQALEIIRHYHKDLIKDLGVSPLDFNMKMPFYDKHKRNVVGIFASEFKKERGFYFELVTRGLEPVDSERRVYRVPPSQSFDEEYELNEKGSYLVPLEELRVINPQAVAISKSSAVTSLDRPFTSRNQDLEVNVKPPAEQLVPKSDAPYNEMTIRDYIAIHTGKPVSLKSWVNDIVGKQNNNLPF
jgi:hypothetical protein